MTPPHSFPSSDHVVNHAVLVAQLHTHEVVEVCAKILYQVELQRNTLEQMWGFSVEAELIENAERQDELCCYVSRVEDKSVAMQNGECCESNWWTIVVSFALSLIILGVNRKFC